MMRLVVLMILGGVLLLGGCRRAPKPEPEREKEPAPVRKEPVAPGKKVEPAAAAAKAETEAAAKESAPATKAAKPGAPPQRKEEVLMVPPPAPPGAPVPVKTRMVRALLDALNGIQGLEPEHRDGVVQSLLAADEELSRVLGGNSKRLILRANRKPPVPIVAESPAPVLIVPEKPLPPPGPGPVAPPLPPPGVVGNPPLGPPPGGAASPTIESLLKTLDGLEGEDPEVKEKLKKLLLETDQKLKESLPTR